MKMLIMLLAHVDRHTHRSHALSDFFSLSQSPRITGIGLLQRAWLGTLETLLSLLPAHSCRHRSRLKALQTP